MSTKIQWTEETWNPIGGCAKVSPGCKHCYAIGQAHRLAGNPNEKINGRYSGLTQIEGGKPNWTGETFIDEEVLLAPLRRKKPTTYFLSLSDLFFDKRPEGDIIRVLAVMARASWHTFQVLTKYPDRMLSLLEGINWSDLEWIVIPDLLESAGYARPIVSRLSVPLPNVWLGVSVENQQYADERIPLLLKTPAAIRFVSYEPALGPVDFDRCYREHNGDGLCDHEETGIDWIIYGHESGPGARPGQEEWARSAKNQCVAAGVPFFLKQYADANGRKIGTPELDGQQWLQMPEVAR